MSRRPSTETVRRAANRLDQRLAACANALKQRPARLVLLQPWAIVGAAVAFMLLPRRFKLPVLKASLPLALGLLKRR